MAHRIPSHVAFSARAALRDFAHDRSGATLVVTALATPILIGLAGLGVEGGYLYMRHASLQQVADIAVISAANAVMSGGNGATEAKSVAAAMSYVNGANGVTVSYNSPPKTGTYAGVAGYSEVDLSLQQKPFLMSLFRSTSYTVSGRAVAKTGSSSSSGCMLALDPTLAALIFNGGVVVNLPNCAAYVNSSYAKQGAAEIANNASVTLKLLSVVGTIGGSLVSGTAKSGQTAVSDPYASVPFPTRTGCDYSSLSAKSSTSTSPLVIAAVGPITTICGGLSVGNGNYVRFDTTKGGVFLFQDTYSLAVTGGSLTATGATLAFSGTSAFSVNSGTVSITAPTSGTYAGLAVMSATNDYSAFAMQGGSTMNITGAIYLPNVQLKYAGQSTTTGSGGCTQIVSDQIIFTGNSQLGSSCAGTGVKSIGSGAVPSALAE
ncbi:MAG: pilus assembly protein [Hyphomicrobiales bacterium]|nr:pilus assembly protein [Hyphomicrobiales bacterium]